MRDNDPLIELIAVVREQTETLNPKMTEILVKLGEAEVHRTKNEIKWDRLSDQVQVVDDRERKTEITLSKVEERQATFDEKIEYRAAKNKVEIIILIFCAIGALVAAFASVYTVVAKINTQTTQAPLTAKYTPP